MCSTPNLLGPEGIDLGVAKKHHRMEVEELGDDSNERALITSAPYPMAFSVTSSPSCPPRMLVESPTLAKRWKHLWRSTLLNLDCHDLPGFLTDDDTLASAISQILSSPAVSSASAQVSSILIPTLAPPALNNLEELCILAYLMGGP